MLKVLKYSIVFSFIIGLLAYGQERETRAFDYKDFSRVAVGWGMHVKISQSNTYKIEVEAYKDDFNYLGVKKSGSKLKFYITENNYRKKGNINISISMPELTGLDLSGGAEGDIQTDIGSKDFDCDLSGGSELKGNLKCGDVKFSLSGGSVINIEGKGKDAKIEGSGGSIFKLKNLSVSNVDAELSGGSSAKITMNGELNTSQSGGSRLVYYGNAKMGDTDFSGGSGVSKGD